MNTRLNTQVGAMLCLTTMMLVATMGCSSSSSSSKPAVSTSAFNFGIDANQAISEAPFPNDLYLNPDGVVSISSLDDDPVLGELANSASLTLWSTQANTRKGFWFLAPVYFFMNEKPDLDSFANKVRIISLSGDEAGREIIAHYFWHTASDSLGIRADDGDYLMANSTYAVMIEQGVKGADGKEIASAENFIATIDSSSSTSNPASDAYAPLKAWLASNNKEASDYVIASVFSTEAVFNYADSLFNSIDAFVLPSPTNRYGYNSESSTFNSTGILTGTDIDNYFGTPDSEVANYPGHWESHRKDIKQILERDEDFTGGTAHFKIANVIVGSVEVPAFNYQMENNVLTNTPLQTANNVFQHSLTSLIPFTLYLCDAHLADPANLPVSIFSHGGSSIRTDAIAIANANCEADIATIAIDMIYHGGRVNTQVLNSSLIVPTATDHYNEFTGLTEGDTNYWPDYVGDSVDATQSIAPLYNVFGGANPDVIEANLLTIAADTYTLYRHLKESDWSGLKSGLSFDRNHIFHSSLSYGSSFHTALFAARDFKGIVGSVGSGIMLSNNIITAPSNGILGANVVASVLGITATVEELNQSGIEELMLAFPMWLHQKGEPYAYAPYIIRHRQRAGSVSILHSGDSWDETLSSTAQLSFNAALGLEVYSFGEEWSLDASIPGSDNINTTAYDSSGNGISGNITDAASGTSHTAAIFYYNGSCHEESISNICAPSFIHPYPPITPTESNPSFSPSCQIHGQSINFLLSLLDSDSPGTISAPQGDCETVYGL